MTSASAISAAGPSSSSSPSCPSQLELFVSPLKSSVFDEPFEVAGRTLRLTFRSGLASFPTNGSDADTLVQNAEAALRHAKETGEQYEHYALDIHSSIAERIALEHRLQTAIDERQFELYYQPQVGMQSQRIEAVEALLRWNDPERGLVSPAAFLPVLEASGLIVPVGDWVLERALQDCRRWHDLGLATVRVAVNVSPLQLRRRAFVPLVLELLSRHLSGVEHCGLDLEITETAVLQDLESASRKLQVLRDAGVRIALDDFGTGYSSLGLLPTLPVDLLKIDRSFVSGLPARRASATLVASIIQLASAFQLVTVAEGVETPEQLVHVAADELQPDAGLSAWGARFGGETRNAFRRYAVNPVAFRSGETEPHGGRTPAAIDCRRRFGCLRRGRAGVRGRLARRCAVPAQPATRTRDDESQHGRGNRVPRSVDCPSSTPREVATPVGHAGNRCRRHRCRHPHREPARMESRRRSVARGGRERRRAWDPRPTLACGRPGALLLASATLCTDSAAGRVLKSVTSILALLIAWLALTGYVFGADALYRFALRTIALHSAALFAVLAIGALASTPSCWLIEVIFAQGAGGVVARWLLAPAALAPPTLGWVFSLGESLQIYSRPFSWALYAMASSTGSIALILLLARRIMVLDAQRSRATQLSLHDPLTGLANRRAFDERLEASMALAQRYGHPLSLLMVDVDNFKSYNDVYGHPAGDELLRVLSDLLRSFARKTRRGRAHRGEELCHRAP